MSNKSNKLKTIDLYIHSSCRSCLEDKPGYYIAEMRYKSVSKVISREINNTTSYRLLLHAVIDTIGVLKETCIINLYTPTSYGTRKMKNRNGEYRLVGTGRVNSDLKNELSMLIMDGGYVINEHITNKHVVRLKSFKQVES